MRPDLDRLLKKSFDGITIERGRAYAESGAVVDLTGNSREIVALVSGTRRSPYRVLVPLSRSSGLPEPGNAVCTCPMVIRCKHIVATILTYYGDVPWGSFEGAVPKGTPLPPKRTPRQILDAIEHRLAEPVKAADVLVPISRSPVVRPVSAVDHLMPDRPSRSDRVPDERWRVAFVVAPRFAGGWRTRDWSGQSVTSRAAIRAVSQYLRKDGTPGRMERYRTDIVHASASPSAQKLLQAIAVDGGESALLLHLDRLLDHPDLPLYAAGPDGRGDFEHPLAVRQIARIRIAFMPVLVDHLGPDHVMLRPKLLVDLCPGDDVEGAEPREAAWVDSFLGRLVASIGGRWLGWCEGDDRLLSLVRDLLAERMELDAADVAELRDKVLAEKNPLVTVDVPFRRVRMVTRRPRVDLLLHESGEGVDAILAFGYPDDDGVAARAPDETVLVRHDSEFEHGVARVLKEYFAAGSSKPRLLSGYGDEGVTWTFAATLPEFLVAFGEPLLSRGIGLCIESTANRLARAGANVQIRVSSGIDWFDLSASAGEDLDLSRVDTGDPLFGHGFVRNGDRIIYVGADEAEKLREVLALLDPSQRSPRVSRLDLHGAEVLHGLAAEGAPIELRRTAEIARALAADAAAAEQQGAALLYMAHGNTYMPSGSAYMEFVSIMNQLYPQVKTYIALVEGFPSLDIILPQIKADGSRKLLLKPFMTVAGDHTINDMAGDEPESWKSILSQKGFTVVPILKGLGEMDTFAEVWMPSRVRPSVYDGHPGLSGALYP